MNPAAASPTFLGVDLGTSGLKLSLISTDGVIVAEAEAGYDVSTPAAGQAETDPDTWASALQLAARDLMASQPRSSPVSLAAIGFAGQMHGVVLADAHGSPVRPALLWPDQRAIDILPQWAQLPDDVRRRLSNPLVAGMSGPLLTWLRTHEPASLDAAARVSSPKDWLRASLTGDESGDRSDASATLLWDVVADDWSTDALALTGTSRDQLPTLVSSNAIIGGTSDFLNDQERSDQVPVVAGAADAAAALLAVKAATQPTSTWSDSLVVNAGTGIQIVRPDATPEPRTDPVTHLYADAEGGWYEMLAIQNGGYALSWVQRILEVSWSGLLALARESPAGAKGALFVPFLTGERGGVAPSHIAAGWSSLTPSTGRAEMARSAFEAFAFTIRRGINLLRPHPGPLLLSGGGWRDPWVRQLIADTVNQEVRYVDLRSASAVGAAVLAARGIGVEMPVPATIEEVHPSSEDSEQLQQPYTSWLTQLN